MEYFIVYFRTAYPECRGAGGIEKQLGKDCIKRDVCSITDCDSDCRNCTILPPDPFDDDYVQMRGSDYSTRIYESGYRGIYPTACINSSCNESFLIEYCRCPIGELSPKEKVGFVKEAEKLYGSYMLVRLDEIDKLDKSTVFARSSRIEQEIIEKKIVLDGPDVFALCSREELDLLEQPLLLDPSGSGYETVIYRESREHKYEKAKSNYRPVRPPHSPGPIQFMAECQDRAEIITDGNTNGKRSSPAGSSTVNNTGAIRKKLSDKSKPKALPPLRSIIDEYKPFPIDERENDRWILAQNVNCPKMVSLRSRRNEGETITLDDETIFNQDRQGVLNRDRQGRISWKPEEDSQKVFYLKSSLKPTGTKPPKNKK